MNLRIQLILVIAACNLFWCSIFAVHAYLEKKEQPHAIIFSDTLRFKVRELQNEIATLQQQRTALQSDTAKFFIKYNEILSRINSNKSDSAQYKLLQELLHKPDPMPIDVNQAIAGGILCCSLWQNTSQQLRLADSINQLKDTIIATQHTEINTCSKNLIEVSQQEVLLDLKLKTTKNKLRKWRIAGASQLTAVVAAITFYKLTH